MAKIVTLCGSTKFKEDFERINKEFTLKGYIVLAPAVFIHSGDKEITDEQKEELDKLHKKKIDMSDLVYVINKNGYIGTSTGKEIIYATSQGINIIYMETEDKK
jgi:hypothetical protein